MDNDRLIDASDLPLERELIRAAAEETTPQDVRRRALAALGLLVIAPAAAVSVSATASAATATGTTAGAVGKTLWWQAWPFKLSVLLGLGGTAVGGGITWQRAQLGASITNATVPAIPTVARLSRTASEGNAAALPGSGIRESSPPPAELPLAEKTERNPGVAEARGVAPQRRLGAAAVRDSTAAAPLSAQAKGAASIRDEIDRLDQARSALRRGAPDAALGLLREYSARYPNGELTAEAEVVRREAQRASKSPR